jgi:acylphosphatase
MKLLPNAEKWKCTRKYAYEADFVSITLCCHLLAVFLREGANVKVRVHVYISGRVQGVFFRSETSYVAQAHQVTGWIRNMSDGRVEAVFEGEEANVKKLIEFCKRGPSGARVTSVDIEWEQFKGEFAGFDAEYGWER